MPTADRGLSEMSTDLDAKKRGSPPDNFFGVGKTDGPLVAWRRPNYASARFAICKHDLFDPRARGCSLQCQQEAYGVTKALEIDHWLSSQDSERCG